MRPSFFYLILLLPVLFAGGYLALKYNQLEELELRFSEACRKGKIALERKEKKERFLQRYSNAAPYFLDREIESMSFLQNERNALEALIDHPALSDKRAMQSRLDFLKSEENRLVFSEEAIRTSPQMTESEEKQRRPVQMDENDLKKLLSLLEDVPIDSYLPLDNSPQILVTDLRIEKKESPLKTKVLEVEMKLLKRELYK